MTEDLPELREPDLPRTAKVRPKGLATSWITGTRAATKAVVILTGELR
jgi:cobalt-precorrin-5B (C1)-methyltransferase